MALRVIEDQIPDAVLDERAFEGDRVRTGMVTGIPTSTTPDPTVLDQALRALITQGYVLNPASLYPGRPDYVLKGIQIKPFSHNKVRFFARYSRGVGGVPSIYIIRDLGSMSQFRGNQIPGSRKPIRVTWGPNGATDEDDFGTFPIEDTLVCEIPRPVRSLSLTTLLYGRPPANLTDSEGSVNLATWMGKARGYWKLDRIGSEFNQVGGYYTVEAVASTRNFEDWSDNIILKDRFGKYVRVLQADIDDLMQGLYGDVGGTQPSVPDYYTKPGIGVARVYWYPFANFASIFGFDSEATAPSIPMSGT